MVICELCGFTTSLQTNHQFFTSDALTFILGTGNTKTQRIWTAVVLSYPKPVSKVSGVALKPYLCYLKDSIWCHTHVKYHTIFKGTYFHVLGSQIFSTILKHKNLTDLNSSSPPLLRSSLENFRK